MSTLLSSRAVKRFQEKIHRFYASNGRNLPWRKRLTPYRVLISEIMLQQTQVERVFDKYKKFLAAFPDFAALAEARAPELLRTWSGLGYNRRALALRALAQKVVAEYGAELPSDYNKLLTLPGIGKYTAGAIMAFAFNKPAVFMDTNIRRVYIHEFFPDRNTVHDHEILHLLKQTIDARNPRKWFNALMDYGTMLKREHKNPNHKSAHYTRQSPFENSNRQVRGMILKALLRESRLTEAQIIKKTGMGAPRVKKNLVQLEKEGFLRKRAENFYLGR